jgi:hypothetical protein
MSLQPNTRCPICGDVFARGGTLYKQIGGWRFCVHHKVFLMASKFDNSCHHCLHGIDQGDQVLLSKDDEDESWTVLHPREACANPVSGESADRGPTMKSGVSSGPWKVLFLVENAPVEVVKAAYRALAMKYHPDRGGDIKKMQELNAALSRIIQ